MGWITHIVVDVEVLSERVASSGGLPFLSVVDMLGVIQSRAQKVQIDGRRSLSHLGRGFRCKEWIQSVCVLVSARSQRTAKNDSPLTGWRKEAYDVRTD